MSDLQLLRNIPIRSALHLWRMVWIGVLTCWGALGAGQQAAQAAFPFDHLPADTYLVVHGDQLGPIAASFRQTQLGQLLSGDAMAPVIADLQRREAPSPLYIRPWFGADWSELMRGEGAGALAIVHLPKEKRLGGVCLLQGDRAAAERYLESARSYFARVKFTYKKSTATDAELHLFERKKGDVLDTRAVFITDEYFGIATDLSAAQAVLATKPASSLATSKNFVAAQKNAQPLAPGEIGLYAQPFPLWAELYRPGKKRRGERDLLAMSKRLGFPEVQTIVGNLQLTPGKAIELHGDLQVQAKQPLPPALKMFELLPGKLTAPPPGAPGQVNEYMGWRWDVPSGMKAFGVLFDEVNMPGDEGVGLFEDLLSAYLEDPEGPKVDVRKEMFPVLGPQIHQWAIAGKEGESRLVYALECRDAKGVSAILRKFYAGDKEVKEEAIGGQPLWFTSAERSLFVEGEDTTLLPIRAVAVADGYLWFSDNEELIRGALAGNKKPTLITSDDWLQLDKRWQEDASFPAQSVLRLASSLERDYRLLRTPPPDEPESFTTRLLRWLCFGPHELVDVKRDKVLPPFAALSPQLMPLGMQAKSTATGWTMKVDWLGKTSAKAESAESK